MDLTEGSPRIREIFATLQRQVVARIHARRPGFETTRLQILCKIVRILGATLIRAAIPQVTTHGDIVIEIGGVMSTTIGLIGTAWVLTAGRGLAV